MAKNIGSIIFIFGFIVWCYFVGTGHLNKPSTTNKHQVIKIEATGKNQAQNNNCVESTYTKYIGVKEEPGNRGYAVGKFLRYTGLDEGYAWCTAFVSYVLGQCNILNPKTAWTPTLGSHNSGTTIYRRGKNNFPTEVGSNNMIFTLYYSNLGREGHSGFIHQIMPDKCVTVEGNTNGSGGREGDGVHKKVRHKQSIYKVRVFNKRKNENKPQSTTNSTKHNTRMAIPCSSSGIASFGTKWCIQNKRAA